MSDKNLQTYQIFVQARNADSIKSAFQRNFKSFTKKNMHRATKICRSTWYIESMTGMGSLSWLILTLRLNIDGDRNVHIQRCLFLAVENDRHWDYNDIDTQRHAHKDVHTKPSGFVILQFSNFSSLLGKSWFFSTTERDPSYFQSIIA